MKRVFALCFVVFVLVLSFAITSSALSYPSGGFPSVNLLPFPYFSQSFISNGVNFSVTKLGRVDKIGTATADTRFILADKLVLPGTSTYYVSLYDSNYNTSLVSLVIEVYKTDGTMSTVTFNNLIGGTFVYPSNAKYVSIYILVKAGHTNRFTFSPCLFRGSTRYPYSPYVQYYIDETFQEGLTAGTDITDAIVNPLRSASSITMSMTNSRGDKFTNTYTYDQLSQMTFFQNGNINVSRYCSFVDPSMNGDNYYIDEFNIEVVWPELVNSNVVNFTFLGANVENPSADPFHYLYIQSYLENGNRQVSIYNQEKYYMKGVLTLPYNSVSFNKWSATLVGQAVLGGTGYPHLLPDFLISFSSQGTYSEGYSQGFSDGFNIDRQEAIHQSFADGQATGYKNGYSAGLNEGVKINENGNFNSLMTAVVDAPVTVFSKLFDFDILGVNMSTFAQSLLTLCLTVTVVRFLI